MNILITNRLYHPVLGGSVVLTDSIAGALRELEHDVRISTKTRDPRAETVTLTVTRTSSFWELCKQILWSDAVIMIEPSVFYAAAAWLMRKPRIGSLQTWFLAHPDDFNPVRRLQKSLTHFFSRYVAPSRVIADSWGPGHEIIPNGYDPHVFFNEQTAREYDFVFVGRFNLDKGPDLFVTALAELHLKSTEFKALMIGDGETMTLCKETAANTEGLTKRITFAGEVRDRTEVARLLNRSKVIVIPNRWDEPFGMVALEGLACGCRPVITKSGALEEVCGGYASIVPKGNRQALAKAMLQEMTLPQYDTGTLRKYLEKFHWRTLVQRYMDLIGLPSTRKKHIVSAD